MPTTLHVLRTPVIVPVTFKDCTQDNMPLRPCSYENCQQAAERTFGSCMICSRHYCAKHCAANFHECLAETDLHAFETAYDDARNRLLAGLLAQINVPALTSVATKARNGVRCIVPALDCTENGYLDLAPVQGRMGGRNLHVEIKFVDGIVWLTRIHLDDPLLPPKSTQTAIFWSEVATLKFLENTKVPAPKIYAYAPESKDNPVGTSYVLMEKFSGAPLEWGEASREQKKKVMDQLQDIYIELAKHPFSKCGSLMLKGRRIEVGSFAQTPLFSSPHQALGPFDSVGTYLRALIPQQQDLILNGELSSLPVDNYLTFCWRSEMLSSVEEYCWTEPPEFFLKHYDDKGDHILVDADFNITGIIDWEFACLEPRELAFSTPCMMWPVGEFYEGNNDLSEEEVGFAALFKARGQHDLEQSMMASRKMQRFMFFNGGGVSRDREEFCALFHGSRAAWAEGEQQRGSYDEWKSDAIARYRGDEALQTLVRGEAA